MPIENKINQLLVLEYEDCISTLKDCSSGDKKENPIKYLCDSEAEAYDFDGIKDKFCEEYDLRTIRSVDSLIVKGNKIYLIEFKNQKGKSLKWDEIKIKVYESIMILSEKFCLSVSEYSKIEILVVYSPSKKEYEGLKNIKRHLKDLMNGKDEIQQFDVFKKIYDINSFKLNNSEFKEYMCVQ